MNEYLKLRWFDLLASFDIDKATAKTLWEEIVQYYAEGRRAYHNLNHLYDLFKKLDKYQAEVNDLKAVELAIWYHDIVYDPMSKDNEERSAILCSKRLKTLGLSTSLKEKIYKLIWSTKTHAIEDWKNEADKKDNEFLLDLDLSILGSNGDKYEKYTSQIRREYNIVPSFLYFSGRKKVLKHFLEMDRLFKTNSFYEKYEKAARKNIWKELETL
ncbi:MAG: putative metal-dependent HD superfamily phosphohydrolase [Saprospiraceae bacterium]|jgi:predicted metal-dependent HD superfamily phosphohydrolase